MREYLFKGKSKDTGEWVEGDLIHGAGAQKGIRWIWKEASENTDCIEVEVIPETVELCTQQASGDNKTMNNKTYLKLEPYCNGCNNICPEAKITTNRRFNYNSVMIVCEFAETCAAKFGIGKEQRNNEE